MSTPHDNMPEHDPDISALYHRNGDIEPPASLDDAVLSTARRAARQHRQRWMLPLSTAAVLMLGVTILLKLSSPWQFSRGPEERAPTLSASPEKAAREESSVAEAPAQRLAQQAAPAPRPQAELKALKAAPTARAKAESADTLAFSDEASSVSGSAVQETDKKKETIAGALSSPEPEVMKQSGSPAALATAPAEQEVLQPKPWLEKIRKLLEEKKLDEARKELDVFMKHYPKYKLPDDLKSL